MSSELLKRYTRQVRGNLWLKDHQQPRVHCALGLTGEAGEVADLLKKAQYAGQPDVSEPKLIEELGDVFWYLTWLADDLGVTHEQLATSNIAKLAARHAGRSTYSLGDLVP